MFATRSSSCNNVGSSGGSSSNSWYNGSSGIVVSGSKFIPRWNT